MRKDIEELMGEGPEQIASDLAKVVRGDVFADILHRAAYSTDASIYRIVPKCVVAPRDAGDVIVVVDVLRTNGIEVVLPKQLPAPLPAIVYGDVKTARKDLAYNVKHLAEAVREGYKIICSEPSAALCLKQELRHFVAGPDVELVSENTYELMNYLCDLLVKNKLKAPTKSITKDFVYHSPCHLCAVGDETASIRLLQELCGVKVADIKAGCCGLAGTFGMQKKNYELSSQISASLKEALEKSPTKNVLTECAACKMQIEHISDCVVRHPVKILAKAYGILE